MLCSPISQPTTSATAAAAAVAAAAAAAAAVAAAVAALSAKAKAKAKAKATVMAATTEVASWWYGMVVAAKEAAVVYVRSRVRTYVFFEQIHFLRSILRRPHTDMIPEGAPKKFPRNRNRDSCEKSATGMENTGIRRIPTGMCNLGDIQKGINAPLQHKGVTTTRSK